LGDFFKGSDTNPQTAIDLHLNRKWKKNTKLIDSSQSVTGSKRKSDYLFTQRNASELIVSLASQT